MAAEVDATFHKPSDARTIQRSDGSMGWTATSGSGETMKVFSCGLNDHKSPSERATAKNGI